MRFRNITQEVRHLFEHGLSVGPGGEFDWPGYDPEKHGAVTGFVPLNESGEPLTPPADDGSPPAGDAPAGDTAADSGADEAAPGTVPPDTGPDGSTDPAGSEETTR